MRRILISGLLLVAACDDDKVSERSVDCRNDCFVLASAISGVEGANTYVRVMDHIESGELDFTNSREFPGWSDIKVWNGQLFVSSGETPEVMRFDVRNDGSLDDAGVISFATYTADAGMYSQMFLAEDQALLLGDTGEYVFWNPQTLAVTGRTPMPTFADREGLPARPAGDRGMVVRDGLLFEAVAFGDYENYEVASTSAIIVVDLATQQVVSTFDVNCPDLNVAALDDDGNIYFSNWVYSPATTWLREGAATCMIEIPAGSNAADPAATRVFNQLSGGHEGAAFSMLAGNRGIVSIFDESHTPYVQGTEIFPWIFGNNWKSYEVDIATGALTELVGLPWHGGGYYQSVGAELDYVMLPEEGYTRTSVWAIDAQGAVTQQMTMNGWATRLYRVR